VFFSASDHWLSLRRVRDRVVGEFLEIHDEVAELRAAATVQVARLDGLIDALQSQLSTLQTQFVAARDIVLAVRAEVIAARGTHGSLAGRFTAVEARLDALEEPTP